MQSYRLPLNREISKSLEHVKTARGGSGEISEIGTIFAKWIKRDVPPESRSCIISPAAHGQGELI